MINARNYASSKPLLTAVTAGFKKSNSPDVSL